MVVNVNHKQWGGLSLPRRYFKVKAVKEILKRAHAKAENHARVRRPLT